jgi:Trk K+ transport system NAD-binding subunit
MTTQDSHQAAGRSPAGSAPAIAQNPDQLRNAGTGVSIIAIIRGDQAITAPEPSEILRAGDRLVIVSRRQDIGPFRDLIVG